MRFVRVATELVFKTSAEGIISPYYEITYYIYGPVFVPLAEAAASIVT